MRMRARLHRATLVALAFVLAGAAASVAGTGFGDPIGDVKRGTGPDITGVFVWHTASTVTFRVRFATAPPLSIGAREGWVDMLLVGIDVPPRGLTRSANGWRGLDYYAGLHGSDNVAMLVKTPAAQTGRGKTLARPRVTRSGRTLTFSLSRRLLGDPAWIEFVLAAGRETAKQTGGGGDEAPNRGTFHYRLNR
jgi:hypothetical protein